MRSKSNGRPKSMPHMLRALSSYNARLYFSGQGISVIGSWMQMIALSWLAYRITNSVFMLGLISFSAQLPMFLVTPFAGVLIDRWNKRSLLVATQSVSMLQAFFLAALVIFDKAGIMPILLLNIVLGIANAFDMPARQAFLIEIIGDKKDLHNAIALNSAIVNGARMIGPTIAGMLIFSLGEGWCFSLNSLSFLAVILALLAMRLPETHDKRPNRPILSELKEGLSYIYRSDPLREILSLLALANLFATPFAILMPVFARDIFHGNSGTMGFLMASSGLGAMAGVAYLASRRTVRGFENIIAASAWIFGAGLVLFSFSGSFWSSFAMMTIIGFGMMVQMSASNSLLQSIVDDDKRGRVMSFYSLSFLGMSMFGNLFVSGLAHFFGAQNAVLAGGVLFLLGTALFSLKLPRLRSDTQDLLAEKGFDTEITLGINTASEMSEPLESSF